MVRIRKTFYSFFSELNVHPGFFIRNVILSGSQFDHQIVPRTRGVLLLSTVAVVVSFGTQFSLAWYLWTYLPFHPRDAGGSLSPNPPQLNGVWAPDQNGAAKYSVCRTNPAVQVICIGLFLFYILNSVPGIIKNMLIALWSCKFVSEDINGVLRIHYWRSCSFWAGLMSFAVTPFSHEIINWTVLNFLLLDDDQNKYRNIVFLPLSKDLFKFSIKPPGCDTSKVENLDWVRPVSYEKGPDDDKPTMRLMFEVYEMKEFIRRNLAAINPETFKIYTDSDSSSVDADQDKKIEELRGQLEDILASGLNDETKSEFEVVRQKIAVQSEERNESKVRNTVTAAEYLVCLDYCDGTYMSERNRDEKGYHAMTLSIIAFFFGVLPEAIATTMILICGIEYILWSGSKIGSDTNGIEEIVLASVAIAFINDIDEALYDHALPELYKTAHERDRFGLENWIPAEESAEMEDEESNQFSWWPRPDYSMAVSGPDSSASDGTPPADHSYTEHNFKRCMCLTDENLERMNNERYPDHLFCRYYPFLYARKYRYFFQQHLFEGVVWAYGSRGIHIVLLTAASLALVGGFRHAHGCDGPQGAFSFSSWPNTCDTWNLTTAGVCS